MKAAHSLSSQLLRSNSLRNASAALDSVHARRAGAQLVHELKTLLTFPAPAHFSVVSSSFSGGCSKRHATFSITASQPHFHATLRPTLTPVVTQRVASRGHRSVHANETDVANRWAIPKHIGQHFIHTLRHKADEELLAQLSKHLPPPDHPEYYLKQTWVAHLAAHKLTVQADFVAQLGHVVHLIDIRSEDEIAGPIGYIPGVNWFPKEEKEKILNAFPKDALIAIVCSKDSDSREVVRFLKANGHPFAAVMAGGMRTWKLMGFASARDPKILTRRCKPVSVQAKVPQAPTDLPAEVPHISLQQVIEHIGTGDTIQWLKMAAFMVHGRLSCVDGRDDCGVIGTPGGDMGEFIIGLQVLEELLHRHITEAEAAILFQRRLDAFGRFYMHTDQLCIARLLNAMFADEFLAARLKRPKDDFEVANLIRAGIPMECRPRVMELLLEPDHIGCGHLRLLLTQSERYKVRRELVVLALKCFFYSMWEGAAGCDYVALSGKHDERGVTNVTLTDEVHSFTYIPLIPPSIQGKQVFVNHSQISSYLRHQLAEWFLSQTDVISLSKVACAAFAPNMDLLADWHVNNTLSELAKNLPMYSIKFDNAGNCTVEYNGIVGMSQTVETPATAAAEAIENISRILNSPEYDEDDSPDAQPDPETQKRIADSLASYYARGFALPTRTSAPTVVINGVESKLEVPEDQLVLRVAHPDTAIKSVPMKIESPTRSNPIQLIARVRAAVERHRLANKPNETKSHTGHHHHNHHHNHHHHHHYHRHNHGRDHHTHSCGSACGAHHVLPNSHHNHSRHNHHSHSQE